MPRRSTRPASAIGHVERLEGRALMAADVTATLNNGVLSITGTDLRDDITVGFGPIGSLTYVSSVGKGTIATFPTSSIRAISASLGNGMDRINIHQPRSILESVSVNMGDGANEACRVCVGSINNLDIDAVAAVGTSVLVANTVVRNSARIDFGSGAGNDSADISGCQLNSVWVNLGADNDAFRVVGSSISAANVSMGSGRDYCAVARGSEIRSGTIDGGSNLSGFNYEDVLIRPVDMRGVRFINFERVSSPS